MSFDLATFLSATGVVWRESFEAFLIVGILLGLLRKIDAKEHRNKVLFGTAAGIVGSVVLGVLLLSLADDLRESSELWVEALASLLAVAVLTYMIVWMYKHTQHLMGGMHHKVKMALEAGAVGVLFTIPFIAVLREGFETVLIFAADGDVRGLTLWASLAVGLGLAVALGALLFSGTVRLSVENFFAITGGLLALFAAWMLRYGVHELGEIVEGTAAHEFGEFLAHAGSWIAAALYLAAIGFWYVRPIIVKARRADAVPA